MEDKLNSKEIKVSFIHYKNFYIIKQNLFLSNEIAGFFDHQYLWKKLINEKSFYVKIVTKDR